VVTAVQMSSHPFVCQLPICDLCLFLIKQYTLKIGRHALAKPYVKGVKSVVFGACPLLWSRDLSGPCLPHCKIGLRSYKSLYGY
jgi:hypothetical protein